MKKLLGCLLCVMLLFCLSTPAPAAPVYDTLLGSTNLPNASVATEEAWLESIVGPTDYITRITSSPGTLIQNFDPGIGGWTFAIVKIGQGQPLAGGDAWYAYADEPDWSTPTSPPGLDNILHIGNPAEFTLGVSHLTFFGPHEVPEPATMLLLGTGLIVLAGFSRKKFKK